LKTKFKIFIALPLLLPLAALAQTFTVLHSFTATGNDGSFSEAGLTLSGSTLYGTTESGGSAGYGTVFKVNSDGSDYTVLYNFTNSPDGAGPYAGLTLSGSTLYGTTAEGGSSGSGTVFKINTDGSGYTVLKNFSGTGYNFTISEYTNTDGANPAGLTLSGNTLYGTAFAGGTSAQGTVFKINTDGSSFIVLYNFSPDTYDGTSFVNSDGASPYAGVTLLSSTLYGTTVRGGSSSYGTVFQVNTDGLGFTVLTNFTGDDGANSYAGLTLSGSTLYGTTERGGGSDNGTVFEINTNGSDYIVLKNFSATSYNSITSTYTNSDGAYPAADLILSGSTLYGTTYQGGTSGSGTVFKVNTDGSGFTVLKTFSALNSTYTNSDGANPLAGLTLSGSTLYGTTADGGSSGQGTVFSLTLSGPPQISNGSARVQAGVFGFTITAASGQTIIVETSTNLISWQTIWTNILSGTSTNFTDPQWKNHPRRFYRAR
jgi:uncharacterized repeat protein (TIGR03803 family)